VFSVNLNCVFSIYAMIQFSSNKMLTFFIDQMIFYDNKVKLVIKFFEDVQLILMKSRLVALFTQASN